MRDERYGHRDLTFSRWHRTLGDHVTCIDMDFLEYCRRCRQPLAFIETARDVGQGFKPTTVQKKTAEQANVPAYCVLYKPQDVENEHAGIASARGSRVFPTSTAGYITMSSTTVGDFLTSIHDRHQCAS